MKYKTEIDVLAIFSGGGKARRKLMVTYGKPVNQWMHSDYQNMERYIRKNGILGRPVDDVAICSAKHKGAA